MQSVLGTEMAAQEGITPSVSRALDLFAERTKAAYGRRLLRLMVFGSRARGSASRDSDVDVAVVLDAITDPRAERERLSDIAYEVIVETGEEIQAWPISKIFWEKPEVARNPLLIAAMRRDGIDVLPAHDRRTVHQGR